VSTCDPDCAGSTCSGEADLDYRIKITNGITTVGGTGGSIRERHLSAHEKGMVELYGTCSAVSFLLAFGVVRVYISLKKVHKAHMIVKILLFSVFVLLLSTFLHLAYWHTLDHRGTRTWSLLVLAHLCTLLGEVGISLILLLLAKGWAVVRRKLPAQGRLTTAVYCTLYFWSMAFSYIWAVYTSHLPDNASASIFGSLFSSYPGMFALLIRTWCGAWAFRIAIKTYQSHSAYRGFFVIMCRIIIVYFFSLPLAGLIADTAITEWVRLKFVTSIEWAANCLLAAYLIAIYNPKWRPARRAFSFHRFTSRELGLAAGELPKHPKPDNCNSLGPSSVSNVSFAEALYQKLGRTPSYFEEVEARCEKVQTIADSWLQLCERAYTLIANTPEGRRCPYYAYSLSNQVFSNPSDHADVSYANFDAKDAQKHRHIERPSLLLIPESQPI